MYFIYFCSDVEGLNLNPLRRGLNSVTYFYGDALLQLACAGAFFLLA